MEGTLKDASVTMDEEKRERELLRGAQFTEVALRVVLWLK